MQAGKQAVKKEASGRTTALRALAILERMGEGLLQGEAAAALAAALLPLLEQAHGPKYATTPPPLSICLVSMLSQLHLINCLLDSCFLLCHVLSGHAVFGGRTCDFQSCRGLMRDEGWRVCL